LKGEKKWLSDLPESLLRRFSFVTPSNNGTQKRRKNEQGTKKERTKQGFKGRKWKIWGCWDLLWLRDMVLFSVLMVVLSVILFMLY
jgi:hypothetical protein